MTRPVSPLTAPAFVIGLGQLGGVFARGFLRCGRPVVPVVRGVPVVDAMQAWRSSGGAEPHLVLVAVGERDLPVVLDTMVDEWRDRIVLIQNELLPDDWLSRGFEHPTVMSVWFEKRKTFEPKVLRPSPVFGPLAPTLAEALAPFDIPVREVPDHDALVLELVVKNVYILVKNAAGLAVGGTGRTLWANHAALAEILVDEALTMQAALTERAFDTSVVHAAVREGFDGGPDQSNAGRSAPARVTRALAQADMYRLAVPTLRRIAEESGLDA